jgi:diguanylate cyclase (GGDEF)-like protein
MRRACPNLISLSDTPGAHMRSEGSLVSVALILSILLTVLLQHSLTMYVAIRTWYYRPSRLFVLVACAAMSLNVGVLIRMNATNESTAYIGQTIVVLALVILNLSLLLLFSALFMAAWWHGSRPIRWIALPYILALIVVGGDLFGQLGLFIDGMRLIQDLYYPVVVSPGGQMMLSLFALSWLPHLVLLGMAFLRRPHLRTTIFLIALSLASAAIVSRLSMHFETAWFNRAAGLVQTLPFIGALAYAILQGRLFEPTRAALELALRSMKESLAVLDAQGIVVYANPEAVQLGLEPGRRLGNMSCAAQVGHDQIALLKQHFDALKQQPTEHTSTLIMSGKMYEVTLTPVTSHRKQVYGALLLGRDVTELMEHATLLEQERTRLAEAVDQLGYLASHDSLTNLPNRRSLYQALERTLARVNQGQESALLFVDLDNFKVVNDTLGHAAGDQVLVKLSHLLLQQLRGGDLLARLGGDEFAVLLENVHEQEALEIAERLRISIDAARFTVDGRSFNLSISVGLVMLDIHKHAEVLLTQADIAMYIAKEQGRNRVMRYDPAKDSSSQLSAANQWVVRIKDALQENRLLFYFQPIIDLDTHCIAHYEVLLRLRDEDGTIIPPVMFIPPAEQFGLMPQLDRWIVREAIRVLEEHDDVRLFVNLSGQSLVDEALLSYIEAALRVSKISPNRLGFEITETAAVQDVVRAEHWIRRLKALGCCFALDDFGVGFTSFSYLRNLPIDKIKIDGSFIRQLDRDPNNRAIVEAIHSLAVSLGKTTVAEFVENEGTVNILKQIGVTYAQGYYLGKPSPSLDHGTLLSYESLAIVDTSHGCSVQSRA